MVILKNQELIGWEVASPLDRLCRSKRPDKIASVVTSRAGRLRSYEAILNGLCGDKVKGGEEEQDKM